MGTATADPSIKDRIEETLKGMRAIAAAAEEGNRDYTDDERSKLGDHLKSLSDLKAEKEKAERGSQLADAVKAALGDAGDEGSPLDTPTAAQLNELALAGARPGVGGITPVKSLGERFVTSKEYTELLKRFPRGEVPEKARIQTDPFEVGSAKALLTGASDTSAGAFVTPQQYQVAQAELLLGFRELTIRDVITNGTTTSDLVEYAQLNAMANNAAAVAEATTQATADPVLGGVKPESSITWKKVNAPVITIAHWLAVTKRGLSDAGQLRTLIDSFLRQGLLEALEDMIIAGDNTAPSAEFDGILNTTGTQAQAFDTDIFVTVRKAITKVRTVGKARPTAVLLSPEDDEVIDLSRDANERFFGAGPFSMGPSTLWSLPRVVTEAVPAGTAIVGDLRTVVMWDREQATISASDSHLGFFVQNLVAVLAELRAALGIIRPSALVIADVNAL